MTNEELEADLRRVNELLRATEKDRDVWKLTAEKTAAENQSLERQLSIARSERENCLTRLTIADENLMAFRESLRELIETHLT